MPTLWKINSCLIRPMLGPQVPMQCLMLMCFNSHSHDAAGPPRCGLRQDKKRPTIPEIIVWSRLRLSPRRITQPVMQRNILPIGTANLTSSITIRFPLHKTENHKRFQWAQPSAESPRPSARNAGERKFTTSLYWCARNFLCCARKNR